jgi:hypothetical protein
MVISKGLGAVPGPGSLPEYRIDWGESGEKGA